MAAIPDYEQAGELKIGQVGIANLRIRTLDVGKLAAEMRERVRTAPKLFQRAAVILDFGGLSACPEPAAVRALLEGLRSAGVLPVGIAYGTSAIEHVSREVGLPLLAKFRASYEVAAGAASAATLPPREQPESVAAEAAPTRAGGKKSAVASVAAPAQPVEPGLVQVVPVRSGQQVYAQSRDLTVCASVGAGAEVIADGSIHIYGALRGRALAGASGSTSARIFCREFNAELVAIAGTYKVLEEVPANLIGKAVQIWLEAERLHFEELP